MYGGTGIALGTNTLNGFPTAPLNPFTNNFSLPPAGTPIFFSTLNFTGGPVSVFNITSNTTLAGTVVFPADASVPTVFNINGTGNATITPAPGVFDQITNNTGGDIINANLGDVGTFTVNGGNIGSSFNTTSQRLAQTVAVANGNVFPFVDQRIGLTLGNVSPA